MCRKHEIKVNVAPHLSAAERSSSSALKDRASAPYMNVNGNDLTGPKKQLMELVLEIKRAGGLNIVTDNFS